MGSMKVTLCAGAAALFAVLTPAAYAADGGGISVNPASPDPGAEVALRVTGCAERTASAVSAAFVSEVKLSVTGADGTLVGESRIRSSLAVGAYEVMVICGEDKRTVSLPVGRPPSAPASPVAPVKAGGGGAAAHLTTADDDTRTTGPGAAQTVTGLVLAGVAATAVALRRARRSRRTD
ncbi:hypothetical protein STRCI_003206 [Streptomyces cinnabarinus]|uniref:Sortase n=1 Tax=Streptomyces cinnabarinus TaxID=67287 RepID=A0ABY7KEM4_9ACTN|nr:hypothetical protein [Streptomyces cinnabarinus]WAZ21993.1 hypothetical protein STRCI_003206 [Streptomyces cinnabarinus]